MTFKARPWILLASVVFTMAQAAFAEEVIAPSNGKGWGEGTTAESLLNMTRDPESVRKVDPEKVPIPIRGTCTDESGKTYSGDDEEYSQCMNRKSAKQKAVTPASTSIKN